jgi:hypothetical protein
MLYFISHTIGPAYLLHPTPAPDFKTFQVFMIYFSKCPSFSTSQSYDPNVTNLLWQAIKDSSEKSDWNEVQLGLVTLSYSLFVLLVSDDKSHPVLARSIVLSSARPFKFRTSSSRFLNFNIPHHKVWYKPRGSTGSPGPIMIIFGTVYREVVFKLLPNFKAPAFFLGKAWLPQTQA